MADLLPIGLDAVIRPRLYRSDDQPNLLEYIDTTLTESFSLNLTLTRTRSNGYDEYGNTILDQYLIYLLCQKMNPNRHDDLTNGLYRLLHRLIVLNGKISKSFFEYSSLSNNLLLYQNMFNSYTNFIWNELDVNVLLEIGCFLLKYRLRDIFNVNTGNYGTRGNLIQQKILGYFLEMIAVYYLASNHREYFRNSRSVDMIFPSPLVHSLLSENLPPAKTDEKGTFYRFIDAIHENGEIFFDLHQTQMILKNDTYRFLNKKLENKKNDFIKFLDTNVSYRQKNVCRTLKSICRFSIKMHIKQYPTDIRYLSSFPLINNQLQNYLTYKNKLAFEL